MHLFIRLTTTLGRMLRAMRGRPIPMRLPDRHCRRYGHGFCRHQLAPPSALACRTVYVLYRPWGIAILSFLPEETRQDVANGLREQRKALRDAKGSRAWAGMMEEAARFEASLAQKEAPARVH